LKLPHGGQFTLLTQFHFLFLTKKQSLSVV